MTGYAKFSSSMGSTTIKSLSNPSGVALISGVADAVHQGIQIGAGWRDEYSMEQTMTTVALAAGTTYVGTSFGKAASKTVGKAARKAGKFIKKTPMKHVARRQQRIAARKVVDEVMNDSGYAVHRSLKQRLRDSKSVALMAAKAMKQQKYLKRTMTVFEEAGTSGWIAGQRLGFWYASNTPAYGNEAIWR